MILNNDMNKCKQICLYLYMQKELKILKGIHPGVILERELKELKLSKRKFALSIGEHPQTICAIIKGKRDMNIPVSLKIEKALHMSEGYLMTLQIYYSIKKITNQEQANIHPDLSLLRKALFWDTDMQKINWVQQKNAIIKRVFERGNDQEKAEILRFYGEQTIDEVFKALSNKRKTLNTPLNLTYKT
jgi:antitoxin HigA-1